MNRSHRQHSREGKTRLTGVVPQTEGHRRSRDEPRTRCHPGAPGGGTVERPYMDRMDRCPWTFRSGSMGGEDKARHGELPRKVAKTVHATRGGGSLEHAYNACLEIDRGVNPSHPRACDGKGNPSRPERGSGRACETIPMKAYQRSTCSMWTPQPFLTSIMTQSTCQYTKRIGA